MSQQRDGTISTVLDKWLNRLATAWTFIGPIVPGTLAAIVIGGASKGVAWIAQYGAFGIFVSGLSAFALTSVSIALISRGKLWRVEAANRSRLSGVSSPFDPMQPIFQNKRIKLTDLINPYDQVVLDKKFINCELIGPANILIIFSGAKFISNNFDQSDAVEIRDNAVPQNAIAFARCDFEKCRFFKVSMLFQTNSRQAADQLITDLNWLTAVDGPELKLISETGEKNSVRKFFDRFKRD